MKIPFNKPFIIGREISYIRQTVNSGHIAGDGLFTEKYLRETLDSIVGQTYKDWELVIINDGHPLRYKTGG